MPRARTMIRTPERFAFFVLMLCLIAAWAGFIPSDMNQVFIAYLIFWAGWSAWILLEWSSPTGAPAATTPPETLAPISKGLDLDRDREARRRFIEGGTS
jgi:hypothetical protein